MLIKLNMKNNVKLGLTKGKYNIFTKAIEMAKQWNVVDNVMLILTAF